MRTIASETLPEPPGMPKAMLCMMDSAKRTGSWLTMDTCKQVAMVLFAKLHVLEAVVPQADIGYNCKD